MKRILIGAALPLALVSAVAMAQSTPGFFTGEVPSAAQWNSYFAAKQDVINFGSGVLSALSNAINASGGIPSPTPTRSGDIMLWNGTSWTTIAGNNSGTNCLQENASGVASWASSCGGGSSGLTVGSTTISGGTNGDIEYNNAGVLGELATTGSGNVVRATSPTLVTPALGTPSSVTLTNGSGLPISTGVSGLGTSVAATLANAVNASGGIVSPSPSAAGDIAYWNGTNWVKLAGNNSGTQYLSENASGVPSWAASSSSGVTSISTTCPATGPSTGAVTITNGFNVVAKTGSSYAVQSSDCGTYFDVSTGAAFTLTAPTLVSGMAYGVFNNNAGGSGANITISGGNYGSVSGPTSIAIAPQSYVAIIAGPSAGFWEVQYRSQGVQAQAESSNYTVAASDAGKVIEASGSSTTITLLSTITPNYYLTVQNVNAASGASVTLAPGGSNTLNGASTLVLPPGSSIGVIAGSGASPTNWDVTSGVGDDILVFSNSTTSQVNTSWTPNPSLIWATIACKGPGGGAGSGGINFSPASVAATAGAGGGEGASKVITESAKSLGHSSITVTLGAVGTGGLAVSGTSAANGNAGTAGGSTSLAGVLQCAPGGGGAGGEDTGVLSGGGGGAGISPTGNGGNGSNAAGGSAGQLGGTAGSTAGFAAAPTAWCAGAGGAGGVAAPAGAGTGGTASLCGAGGSAGGGVAAAGTPENGGAGNSPLGGSTQSGNGTGGVAAGATGGAGGNATNTGFLTDNTVALLGDGLMGGASGGGGAGAENAAGAATAGAGGTGGIGAGGAGGGAAACDTGFNCTSGAGGNGGASVIEIFERNSATGLNH